MMSLENRQTYETKEKAMFKSQKKQTNQTDAHRTEQNHNDDDTVL
jgi:hypothetical protein